MERYGKDTARIHVRTGDRFLIELPAKATAGYRWMPTWESDVAELAGDGIRPGGSALGATSIQELELVATHPGTGTLRLEYRRPWENVAGERLAIEIVVAA